jgi:hypothetical protein
LTKFALLFLALLFQFAAVLLEHREISIYTVRKLYQAAHPVQTWTTCDYPC